MALSKNLIPSTEASATNADDKEVFLHIDLKLGLSLPLWVLRSSSHVALTKHLAARDALRVAKEAPKSLVRVASTFLSIGSLGGNVPFGWNNHTFVRNATAASTLGISERETSPSEFSLVDSCSPRLGDGDCQKFLTQFLTVSSASLFRALRTHLRACGGTRSHARILFLCS